MPVLASDPYAGVGPAFGQRDDQVEAKPTVTPLEAMGAAFKTGTLGVIANATGNAFDNDQARQADRGTDPTFDPFDHIQGYEQYASHFVDVNGPAELAARKAQIDRENENRQTIHYGGLWSLPGQLAAGVMDPLNLIPFVGAAEKGTALARFGQGFVRNAAIGAPAIGAEEALKQSLSATQTTEESLRNTVTGSLFMGLLGGSVDLLGGQGSAATKNLTDGLKRDFDAAAYGESSVGAAQARTTTLEQEGLANSLGVMKFEAHNPISDNPIARTLNSPSLETRRTVNDLAEVPLYTAGNAEGIASPVAVESRVKGWQGSLGQGVRDGEAIYAKYRAEMKAKGGAKLSRDDFNVEVGRAMRNGDENAIPEVSEAAKSWRERLFEPLKQEAIKAGLLPADVEVETALSYLTRVYDTDKISANRQGFVDLLTRAFEADHLRTPEAERPDVEEMRAQAEDITNKLLHSPVNRTTYEVTAGPRGPLKERTLNIPDAVLEPYLISDIERVARVYTRTMGADVEITRSFGDPQMTEPLRKIEDNYNQLSRTTPDGPAQAKLTKRKERDLRDVQALRDRVRGTYGLPDNPDGIMVRSGRVVRKLNYLRQLGGVTISSVSDAGSTILTHGLQRVFGNGVVPLMHNLNSFRVAAKEAQLAGTAWDLILDGRSMQFGEVFEDLGRYSKVERGLEWASEKFGKVTGIAYWNSMIKQFSSVITQTRMLEAIEALGKGTIKPAELRRLRYQGIDDNLGQRIAAEMAKHGEVHDGLRWANTSAWTDRSAVEAFRAGLVKEVDRIVVTPGLEKPLWMSSELGKTIGQFRSFNFASMSRTVGFALQQRDANTLQGIVAMTTIGMFQTFLKAQIGGRPLPTSPAAWIASGVDQSGLLGWVFDANNTLAKTVGSPFAPPARYGDRGWIESLLGPSAGTVGDALQVARDAGADKFSRGDLHRLRRLIPYQNLAYLRWLFDRAEEGAGDAGGLPAKSVRATKNTMTPVLP